MRSTTPVARHFGERTRHLELDSGTEGVADGEAEEGSALVIGSEHEAILRMVGAIG